MFQTKASASVKPPPAIFLEGKASAGSANRKNSHMVLSYYDELGIRKRCSKSTGLPVKGNKKKAERLLQEAKEAKEAELSRESEEDLSQNILFVDFLKEWLGFVRPNVEASTFDGYNYVVNQRIIPFFEEKYPQLKLQSLTPRQIQLFYQYLREKKKVSFNTVLHAHANLHKALQYAYRAGMIDINPADRVERPRIQEPDRPEPYSDAEIKRLLNKVKGSILEYPVVMGAFYGLRRGEAIGLKWESIDFFGKRIKIEDTVTEAKIDGTFTEIRKSKPKTKSSRRMLPLVAPVEELLLNMLEEQRKNRAMCGECYYKGDQEYIYVNKIGHLIKPGYVTQAFPRFLKKNGFRKIRFHDLRHSCATLLYKHGVGMKDIQEWLGHSTIATTANIYTHLDYSSKVESANAILGVFRGEEAEK